MATLMIRNLDDTTKSALRVQAARNGRSMEEEARTLLRLAFSRPATAEGLGTRIHRRFADLGGADFEREVLASRSAPDFGSES